MAMFLYLLAFLLSLYFVNIAFSKRETSSTNDEINGSIVLIKKRVIDLTDFRASVMDRVHEFFGKGVSFQLVSSTVADPNDQDGKGIIGRPSYLKGWITKLTSFTAAEAHYNVSFNWERSKGIPGAVIVKNDHCYEFYLKSLTLEGVPGKGRIHFVCNSWIFPASSYSSARIFFANDTYLPSSTPGPLKAYREEELKILRGTGRETAYHPHDRIYDYDVYNDLGEPSKGREFERPVLGGSEETPYPRRGRTGPPGIKAEKLASKLKEHRKYNCYGEYLPRDEYFRHLKSSDFVAYKFKSLLKTMILKRGGEEFRSFKDVRKLYGSVWIISDIISWLAHWIPFELIKELLRSEGESLIKFPVPQIIKNDNENSNLWANDKEFTRQMLAGLNPVLLRAAEDEEIHEFYENKRKKNMMQETGMDDKNINRGKDRRFFVLDHTSYMKKYNLQDKIYEFTKNKVYASKTLLYLEEDESLRPEGILLIERTEDQRYKEEYYFPAEGGVEGGLWMLAKAFVVVNDSGYHQLISHWLYTHAVIEPFVIATNRRLSVMHPVYKLLCPHFSDTMNMNNLARHRLINADGIIERTFFAGSFAMQMTSEVYKDWNFMDQALPTDLINRGVAVKANHDNDDDNEENIRLLIKDYPFAVDGLEVWSEIKRWVTKYCSLYYNDDAAIQADAELQQWWKEVREVGHGDLKDKPWWPKMQTKKELIDSCTIIIWLASAFHAAINFSQYAYAGYVPNRPTFTRKKMPETEEEIMEMQKDPEEYFLRTITSKSQMLAIISVLQILSRHTNEEVYIGQKNEPEWTSDRNARLAFDEFHSRLKEIVEVNIDNRNWDESLKNRNGEVRIPYTSLYPNTSGNTVPGLLSKGVPNSVSI